MLKILVLTAATLFSTSVLAADIDEARVAFRDTGDMACVKEMGGTLDVKWTALDLNSDGQSEYLVRVGGYGNGASGCFGQAGATLHLMTRTDSGWRQELGFSGIDVTPRPRRSGQWADLEIGGPGSCFPVWRNDDAGYGLYKSCD